MSTQRTTSTLIFASFLFLRFLIALLLGAQVGLIVFFTPAQPWLFLGPVILLLAASLLSLGLDPEVRHERISRQRLIRALWRALLTIVAPTLALMVLGVIFTPVWTLAELVFFLETSLLIAFTVGGRISWQAISTALIGWLGFGIVVMIDAVHVDAVYQSTPGFHFDPFPAVDIAITCILLGFAISALGGHLGRLLRIWMLG